MGAAQVAVDRSLVLNRHQRIVTGWIRMHQVRLASAVPMALGDVERAHAKALQNREATWPPPVGYWEMAPLPAVNGFAVRTSLPTTFVLTDGRHEFIARLMLGQRDLFVAWVETVTEGVVR